MRYELESAEGIAIQKEWSEYLDTKNYLTSRDKQEAMRIYGQNRWLLIDLIDEIRRSSGIRTTEINHAVEQEHERGHNKENPCHRHCVGTALSIAREMDIDLRDWPYIKKVLYHGEVVFKTSKTPGFYHKKTGKG